MANRRFWLGMLVMVLAFGMVVAGCDDGSTGDKTKTKTITIDGWEWMAFGDQENGGTSTITMKRGTGGDRKKLTFTGELTATCPNGEYEPYGFAASQAQPNESNLTALKNADGFSFKCKGDVKKYMMIVSTTDVEDYSYHRYIFEVAETEQTIKISYDELEQPGWGVRKAFDKNNIKQVEFQANSEITDLGQFSITIWDLQAGNS
jgi:hypothetical protein